MNAETPRTGTFLVAQPRMLLLLGTLIFLGFFLTSGISYMVSRDSIRRTILNDDLPLTSDNIYSEIQRDLFEPIMISSLMANDTFVKDWILGGEKNVPQIERYLHQIQSKYGTVTSFLVSDATRNYYHSDRVLKVVREDEPIDSWFFRVRGMAKDYEINVDPDMANRDAMTIFINYRVLDRQGHFLAATGVGLTVNAVKALMQAYHERYHREIFFYDRKGQLVLHSLGNGEAAGDPPPDHVSGEAFREVLTELASGKNKVARSVVDARGAMVNYRYIPELDWILVVEQAGDGTHGILLKSFGLNLLICLFTTVALLGIIHLTVLRYQKNLETRNRQLLEKNTLIETQARELKKANETLDAMHREKDEFIGITAHDLKTPLNSVFGFSQLLLLDNSVQGETREFAEHIHNSSHAMLEHVGALLELTELEAAPSRWELGEIDARAIVERIADDFRAQASAKGITISGNLGSDPVPVHANEKGLTTAVSNLLSNAIKYSPKGGTVTLDINARHGEVQISVKDQGEGIPADEHPLLFKKFGRLSPKPTAGEGSTGLGLYIVEQMTLRMGGSVGCLSKKGGGSTFTITLPSQT